MAYVEDNFVDFFDTILTTSTDIEARDLQTFIDFFVIIDDNKQLTQKQGALLLSLLKKYQAAAKRNGVDYANDLSNPVWKNPFRILDLSKRIFVDKDSTDTYSIFVKFPYSFTQEFEKEFPIKSYSVTWSTEKVARKFPLVTNKIIALHEFAVKYKFEIDDSFLCLLSTYEEILNTEDQFAPCSIVIDEKIELINPTESALELWHQNTDRSYFDRLLLAKSMGYSLSNPSSSIIETIASSTTNKFWIKDTEDFLNLYQGITGKVCIILDRVSDHKEWLLDFDQVVQSLNIPTTDIKVCFRTDDQEFNEWIKKSGYGGKVDTGRLLIFNHKPAKWLFKDLESVKIIVSNSLYPSTNLITKDLMNSHPCVIYLGDIKPSALGNQKIVKL